jgi:hypothetical protein
MVKFLHKRWAGRRKYAVGPGAEANAWLVSGLGSRQAKQKYEEGKGEAKKTRGHKLNEEQNGPGSCEDTQVRAGRET